MSNSQRDEGTETDDRRSRLEDADDEEIEGAPA
jgi:hypothetical protein